MNLSYELPKKIFCTFANDSIAEIELIQNEAVAIWWRSYVQNNFMGTYTQSHDPELKGDPKFKEDPVSVSMINQHIDKVEEITDTDWGIRAYDGMDHSITNSIHRMFTTSTATYQKTHLVPDSTRNFIIDKKQNEFIDHHTATTRVYKDSYNHEITHFSENRRSELQESLQSINSWIHIYEANRQYSNRSVTDKITNTIVVDIDLKNVDGSYIWAHKYEEIAQPELSVDLMHLVHTKPGANVYANKKIMGKDYFTTYFDQIYKTL